MDLAATPDAYRVLKPDVVPFLSYPFEWSFSQLKDAAQLTLDVQARALERGMTLRDASAYNIQFLGTRPILIDTLSLGRYEALAPWNAYRQFCQHFLVPLALMSQVDISLGRLLQIHLDGIPIDLASRLLPRRTWIKWGTALHIHLHARSLARHMNTRLDEANVAPKISPTAMRGLIDNLQDTVQGFRWRPAGTEWAEYGENNNYTAAAHEAKAELMRNYLSACLPTDGFVWDLGANTGRYSRLAADLGANVVAFDMDPAAVERNYLRERGAGDRRVLPLLLDLANPSPAIGWSNEERHGWLDRRRPDVILALALIHHLAISNNVPLRSIAELFARVAPNLVIEFVPKSDGQVQRLLGSRLDIFHEYNQGGFETAFGMHYKILRKDRIPETARTLYLLRRV